ncbi:MAG: IS5 family transposase [Betaproteobacteria bacterium]|nr:IS5 family transposase [Betaproteobacteria bacterium]
MQASFSEFEYESKKKVTRRDRVLSELERLVPWAALEKLIEPYYFSGKRGRPPIGLSRMLRMYVVQNCFNLSDEGVEDAVYDSQAIRRFVGVDIGRESAPDKTTVQHFRVLLEQHDLTRGIFDTINANLSRRGLILKKGTVVDATIINAPSSTKNEEGQRDEEMHQTKKGNQYYFGMKAHIGVDAETGTVHSLVTTAANASDVTQAHALLQGEETDVFADAGYQGVEKREENQDTPVNWHVAMRPGKRKTLQDFTWGKMLEKVEKIKASVRAKVEHPFHIIKNRFGLRKVRYRGLAKNTAHLYTLFGLANLFINKKRLDGLNGIIAS